MTFRSVSFTYPESDSPALKDFTLSIKAGERVGIIGRIGSGKTTIGRLLAGLYPPSGGGLLIDGVDIRQYHPAEVRIAVAFASQGADLFSGTINENLLMAKPDATDDEIVEVARVAGVDEFVARHPRGYDMPVGERGSRLSGGQRQAVAIARILLRKPKIVFLDEPSGAMDMARERELLAKLGHAFEKDVTLIISTHRSMLRLVDRLVVVEQDMNKLKLGLAAFLFAGLTGSVQSADLLSGGYCPIAQSSQLLTIQSDAELTTEVVRLMDEAVAVADSSQWVNSSRPAFVWASEAKVACGKAYGYLRASYRDEDYLNKCECFHARMVRYMY